MVHGIFQSCPCQGIQPKSGNMGQAVLLDAYNIYTHVSISLKMMFFDKTGNGSYCRFFADDLQVARTDVLPRIATQHLLKL